MTVEQFYSKIENPIDNLDLIKKLVLIYSKTNEYANSFYIDLVGGERFKYKEEQLYDYNIKLFNIIKNNFTSITKTEYEKYNYFIQYLSVYFSLLPKVETKTELDNLLDEDNEYLKKIITTLSELGGTEELCQEFEKDWYNYFKNNISFTRESWKHIYSRNIRPQSGMIEEIYHRLYLNMKPESLHEMIIKMIEKFDENQLPYYFKYAARSDRTDSIVLYSDSKKLFSYIELLKEIKEENKDLKFQEPPLLAGKIDDFIGYGSYSFEDNEKGLSYNFKRARIIEVTIEEEVTKWIVENKNKKVKYKDDIISLGEYFNEKFLIYAKDELNLEMNEENLKEEITKGFVRYVGDTSNETDDKISDLAIIPPYIFSEIIKERSGAIVHNYPEVLGIIQKRIKEVGALYGIDKDNFCFNQQDLNNPELKLIK